MTLTGKTALITGGSSGIGLGIAKELASLGAKVIITGRQEAKLESAAAEIGTNARAVKAEVSDLAQLDRLYATIEANYSTIDILVANAGGGIIAPLGAVTEKQVDTTFSSNVKGVIFTVQKALPLMKAGASIVLIGSTSSIQPGAGLSVYGASKAALRDLVRSWVLDIKDLGIRINIVSPGPVRTQSLLDFLPDGQQENILAYLESKSTVGRLGQPEDIAKAVAFLAGEGSGYVNGIELFVDGGASQV
ncbi:SDR family NAD(P)-dependent oxidoreductase [uncultured Jannaschia sp.]|uniref:SDR family NAD(P)-dependent oxidoreductase n=1 Tax=uncultured Jannaschia sp. TaxID=293347 RepID=UPI00261288C5|nr:SDR family oxidoreductase [uncultured Jannaschia sp.]